MRRPGEYRRSQKSSVLVALLLFNLTLVLLQLWLFVSVLENLLGGHTEIALPATFASIVIMFVNVWVMRGGYRLEDMD